MRIPIFRNSASQPLFIPQKENAPDEDREGGYYEECRMEIMGGKVVGKMVGEGDRRT